MMDQIQAADYALHWLRVLMHNQPASKTALAGFGDLFVLRRTTAAIWRYFFVRMPLRAFCGRVLAGVPSGTPVPLDAGSPTPLCTRPPHLAMGRGFNPVQGGHTMAALPIHSRSAYTYPLTEIEARHSVRLWFTGKPALTLAAWRDNRCHAHCSGLPEPYERGQAFNQAFSQELASIIAGGMRV